jgi:amino acid transporter
MSTTEPPASGSDRRGNLLRAAKVIIVSSVMFTFISYWRTAAVVLCDLASTAYYIGGIVEQSIGPAAPWFILAVMLFSYAVRSVYLESCSLFVRGGVYRVVKEAMGGFLAKLSVSALMFDYILTGPISGVSAGQYVAGLILDTITLTTGHKFSQAERDGWKAGISVAFACAVTIYFFWQNIKGIHESSDKALKIMIATTIMAVIVLAWCGLTLAIKGPAVNADGSVNSVPLTPNFNPKVNPSEIDEASGQPKMDDPLGFISRTRTGDALRGLGTTGSWLSVIGVIGILLAFGHAILAMSGEETLAQVYREVEAPKMVNFKKAAFVVFVYSLVLTGGISFLAVLLIPNDVRMKDYADNLIGGLAMSVIGPDWVKLLLQAFVVVVGAAILSGAVNTAIIGSNGVLNRVAEDGVMPDWFLRPHPKFGTTYRMLYLIVGLQLFTILASRGDVLILGEAYAFGVVWSFVFKSLAMVVLRFTEPGGREFKVPLNIQIGKYEIPVGLILIFLVLMAAAILNLLTKETATTWGLGFTAAFLTIFVVTERYHEGKRQAHGGKHEHMEQFNQQSAEDVTRDELGLKHPYRKLVAIRSPHNLFMLEKALAETDPETTDVIVMTAKLQLPGATATAQTDLDTYDQELMTAVVQKAEHAGKEVHPLIVPTNNPLHAVLRIAKEMQAQELIMGASNKFTADEQLDQISFFWISLHDGAAPPLTVRVLSRDRDMYLDLNGGNRIPKISERKARTVAELRAAGVGVDRVLLVHSGTPRGSDLFQDVLTMLDPEVALDLVAVIPPGPAPFPGHGVIHQDRERARQLSRDLQVFDVQVPEPGAEIVRRAREGKYDVVILSPVGEDSAEAEAAWKAMLRHVSTHAHCPVFQATLPSIPQEVVAET